jgi:hypothetical protein
MDKINVKSRFLSFEASQTRPGIRPLPAVCMPAMKTVPEKMGTEEEQYSFASFIVDPVLSI